MFRPAMTDTPVRVRFAPSPTGYLHVGGARTALFNWLYARKTGGTFVLRIEDTDKERSTDAHTQVILEGLTLARRRLGRGPVLPGRRTAPGTGPTPSGCWRTGMAYRCFCTAEELDAERKVAVAAGAALPVRRRAGPAERRRRARAASPRAIPFVIRFAVPEAETRLGGRGARPDQLPGPRPRRLRHPAVRRHRPIYNLAVVSDDIAMRITHVMRGDDHVSNTPKQIALYQALGAPLPVFAHVPMILGTDGKKLSKRHGATAVGDYQDQGILPSAMRNFLALLGWSPGGDREMLTGERDDRALLARGDPEQAGGVRHRQAGVDERAVSLAARRRTSCSPPVLRQLERMGVDRDGTRPAGR